MSFLNRKKHGTIGFTIHPMTIVLFLCSILVGMFSVMLTYFICIVFHEFCHAIVAKKLGYKCNKITLYPTGAILYGETDEFTFKDEILVSLAGPLSNAILCILIVFFWWIFPEFYNFTNNLVVANLSIFMLNILPIFPLDGGRILLAFLSDKLPRKSACKIAKIITIIFSCLLVLYFIISLFCKPNFSVGLVGILIMVSAIADDKQMAYKRLVKTDIKKRRLFRGIKCHTLAFNQSVVLSKIISKIDNFAYYTILVFDDDFNLLKKISEKNIEKLCIKFPLTTKIGDCLNFVN